MLFTNLKALQSIKCKFLIEDIKKIALFFFFNQKNFQKFQRKQFVRHLFQTCLFKSFTSALTLIKVGFSGVRFEWGLFLLLSKTRQIILNLKLEIWYVSTDTHMQFQKIYLLADVSNFCPKQYLYSKQKYESCV